MVSHETFTLGKGTRTVKPYSFQTGMLGGDVRILDIAIIAKPDIPPPVEPIYVVVGRLIAHDPVSYIRPDVMDGPRKSAPFGAAIPVLAAFV
jgi:hypothetical protein